LLHACECETVMEGAGGQSVTMCYPPGT